MKTYTIKNYKGNLVESLKKFQEKYPDSKIVEATEEDGALKIKIEEANAKKLAIAQIDCKTGQANFIKDDFRVPKAKLDIEDDGLGLSYIHLVRGFSNTKENLLAANYVIDQLNNRNDEQMVSELISAEKAWAVLPYSAQALAKWTGKMASCVSTDPPPY